MGRRAEMTGAKPGIGRGGGGQCQAARACGPGGGAQIHSEGMRRHGRIFSILSRTITSPT